MPYPANILFPSYNLFPSDGNDIEPYQISWSQAGERFFEAGLDRGVLYPNGLFGVPWNGLISVDETGAESSVEFFMDGRPFLYLPKPKEFTATLTAYTYPDEFAEIMGLSEVAAGMFIDSQQLDSFGLSYRTHVGNDLEGVEAGYKIHLIYNATVVPQSVTYVSIADTVTPSDLSWEIRAVPVPLSGYRSSAHIIIDTRGIAPELLTELEAVIYGDGDTLAPSLPTPQSLSDFLNYASGVTITDNDDGTWTAAGPSGSITMIGENEFQVDDVFVIDHGDGTYDVSSIL